MPDQVSSCDLTHWIGIAEKANYVQHIRRTFGRDWRVQCFMFGRLQMTFTMQVFNCILGLST